MSYYINFSECYDGYGIAEISEDEIEESINAFMDVIVEKFNKCGIDNVSYDKIDIDEYNLHVSENDVNRLKLISGIDPTEYFDQMECMVARHNGGHHVECTMRISIYWYLIK